MTTAPPRAGSSFVGLRQLAPLLAGRAGFRLVQYGATALLLPAWGIDRYDAFAAALAATSWLIALTSSGPEKVALKLLPRAPRTGVDVAAAAVAMAWALPLACGLVATAIVVTTPGAAALAAAATAAAIAQGGNLVLVGLHRARGSHAADTANHVALSFVLLGLVTAAALGALHPVGYLLCLTAALVAANGVLTVRLGIRPSLRITRRPRFARAVVVSAGLLGGADVCLYLGTSVLFALLAATGGADGAGVLYIVALVDSAVVNVFVYVLRVQTPATSRRLVGSAAAAGRHRAARFARVGAVYAAGWLVAAAVVLAATGWTRPDGDVALAIIAAALFATRAPGIAATLFAGFVLENTDARAVRTTGAAAAAGLAAVVVTGAVVVPMIGAVGVVVAGAAQELVQGAVLAARATRQRVAEPAG